MPTVAHFITGLDQGGAEEMLYKILQENVAMDRLVISLTGAGTYGKKIRALGIEVVTLELNNPAKSVRHIATLIQKIRSNNITVFMGWMYHACILASIFSFFFKSTTCIWNIRQSLDGLKKEKLSTRIIISITALLSDQPSKILYNSHTSRKQHEQIGFNVIKGQVIPNGFDLSRFNFSRDQKRIATSRYELPGSSKRIGIIARFHPVKGYDVLVKAARKVIAERQDVSFVCIGPGVTKQNFERLPGFKHCQNNFILLEKIDAPETIIHSFDLTLNCSYGESFANSIGESMACGVPVIASNVGDSALLIDNPKLMFTPGDANSLADLILHFFEMSTEELAEESHRVNSIIKDKYSIQKIASDYAKAYEKQN